MSLEENKAIVRKLTEAFNKQDLSLLDDLMAPDCVDHTRQLHGLEAIKQYMTMLFKASPDSHGTIEDIIAERDKVWVRYKNTATDPTGKKIELASINIFRIVNGKVVEGWGGVIRKISVPKDTGELYNRLGIIEPTQKPNKLFP